MQLCLGVAVQMENREAEPSLPVILVGLTSKLATPLCIEFDFGITFRFLQTRWTDQMDFMQSTN